MNKFFIEYLDCIKHAADSSQVVADYVGRSGAKWAKKDISVSRIPAFFDKGQTEKFKRISSVLHNVLGKVLREYFSCEDYAGEFMLGDKALYLVNLSDFKRFDIPVIRADFIYDEQRDELHFCEFNIDAASGMLENAVAVKALGMTEEFRNFSERHSVYNWFDDNFNGLADLVIDSYRQSPGYKKGGNIAIVVCFDSPNPDAKELMEYAGLFEKKGYRASVYDIRNLYVSEHGSLKGRNAIYNGNDLDIDFIWRFVTPYDCIVYFDEIKDYMEAVKNKRVFQTGNFSSILLHDKLIMEILCSEKTFSFLDADERDFVKRHVPRTKILGMDGRFAQELLADKDSYIVKPRDMYCSLNVTNGRDVSRREWGEAVSNACKAENRGNYIAQEFHEAHLCENQVLNSAGRFETRQRKQVFSMYVHNGKFAGLYIREGESNIVGNRNNDSVVAAFGVNE